MLRDRERIMLKIKIKRKVHRKLYTGLQIVQLITQIDAFYLQFGLKKMLIFWWKITLGLHLPSEQNFKC
jgi:uncharacterized protein YebE (UPF0316 family)